MDRKESFWMAMIENYQKRNYDLDDRQCNLKHPLDNRNGELTSPETSSSCTCSSNSTTSSASNKATSSTKVCVYKHKFINYCEDQSNDSMEMEYIAKLHDLVNREKQLKMQVHEMEVRERAFVQTLKRADQMYTTLEKKCNKHRLDKQKLQNANYEKMAKELLQENSCLCDELQDTKLELKHCIEKLQGPIARQMEQERRKSKTLENELKLASKEMENKDCCYSRDMCTLQKQLAETTKNLRAINALNDKLQKQMCSLSCKYKQLQKELINHKINEARTLEMMNAKEQTFCKETRFLVQRKKNADPDSLYAIARKLSKSIANVERCECCSTKASQDLKDTMRGIVFIADLIDSRIKQGAGTEARDPDNKKPPPSSSRSLRRTKSTNMVNEQPVRDVNVCKPAKMCTRCTTSPGVVDDDTYAPIDSMVSCSSLQSQCNLSPSLKEVEIPMINNETSITPRPETEDLQVLTQVETTDDLKILVETDVDMCDKISDQINITTAFTKSGVLEIVTEGPAGIIETTMTQTPCGSVDIITKVVDYPEEENAPKLNSVKNKISAPEGVRITQFRSTDSNAGDVASFTETSSVIPLEGINRERSPEVKKPKTECLGLDLEIGGCVVVEDFNVHIEMDNPFFNGLKEKDFARKLRNYYKNESNEVEYVLGSGDKGSGEIIQKVNFAHHLVDESVNDIKTECDAVISIRDIDNDRKLSNSKNVYVKEKNRFRKRAPSFKSVMTSSDECDCDGCLCGECSPKCMARRKLTTEYQISENDYMDSEFSGDHKEYPISKDGNQHPPDCDCIECLCKPCASFPADYKTRVHPPGCNCIDCLCMKPPCYVEHQPKLPSKETTATTTPASEKVPMPTSTVTKPIECIKLEEENLTKPPIVPYSVVEKQSHTSTCTCIDCLLTCGVREKPKGICKGCNKVCNSAGRSKSGCNRKPADNVSVCSCDACLTSFCYDDQPLKLEVPINNRTETTPKTEKKSCCCDEEPSKIEKESATQHEKDLQELQTCLQQIQCSCAEAEDAVTNPCAAALKTFRGVVETLRNKCKEKDKMISGMIKSVKDRMDDNLFGNLCSKQEKSGSNIYSCACDDDRSVMEEFKSNPCKCIKNEEDYDGDSSSSSSCSICCTEFEPTRSNDTSSEDSSSCSYCDANQKWSEARQESSCCCIYDEGRRKKSTKSKSQFRSASNNVCLICYPEQQKPPSRQKTSELQRLKVCMKSDTLKQQITNAPLTITDLTKIDDGLLIKWSKPTCNNVLGYEVLINGQMKTKVRSSDRTLAMIYNTPVKKPVTVAVYVITSEGRQQPAAKAVFKYLSKLSKFLCKYNKMLSPLELPCRKTTKRKRRNYSFKTLSNYRQQRLTRKCYQSSTSNVTFQNILQNNIAKSLTRSYIPKDVDEEPLFEKYSKMKRELNMREVNIKKELASVRDALRKSLEERLFNEISEMSIQLSSEHCSLKQCSKSEIVDDTEQNGCGDSFKAILVDGVSVTAKAEDSRTFEIETEHSSGSIKSHIIHKPSGNIEIVTQVEYYSDKPLQQARSDLCSTVSRLVLPPTSISTTELMLKETTPVKELETITKTSHVYDSVTRILQKLNDSVVYALDHVNKNISKAMGSLNENIKLALTVVVRDEIQKVVTEHLANSQKNLVTTSTSHNNLTSTADKELEDLRTRSTSCAVSSNISNHLQEKCSCACQTFPTHNTSEQGTQLTFDKSMDPRREKEFVVKTTSYYLAPAKALEEGSGVESKKRKVRSPNFTKAQHQKNVDLMHSEIFLADGEYPPTNDAIALVESKTSSSKNAINRKTTVPFPNPEFLMLQFKSNSCLPLIENKECFSTDETPKCPTRLIESTTVSSCVVTQPLTEATINDIQVLPSDSEQTDDTFVTSHIYCESLDENKIRSETKCCFKINGDSSGSDKFEYVVNKKRRFTKSKSSIGSDRKVYKPNARKKSRKNNLSQHLEEREDMGTTSQVATISSYDCFQRIHAEYCKRNQRNAVSQLIDRRQHNEPQKIERLKEKIKLANMCDEELKKFVKINAIDQNNCFESTLTGLQNALTSLKTKLEQADDKIKKVSDNRNTVQTNKQFQSQIPRRKNTPKVPDVTPLKQTSDELNDTLFEIDNEKIVPCDQRIIKKVVEFKRKPSNIKPKKNLRSTTSSTKTSESRYQKALVVQTPDYVQEDLRHCKQELKHFLSFKKNIFPASNSLRKSVPYLQLQDALTRNKTKNFVNFKSSTEAGIKSVTAPKPEVFHRQMQKKKQ
ncbi:hypothetical protein FQR65_LT11631 [Abscondita terminalis]|nr:hypothetical protein FQR65_LT11631 [Abscondita terminalis]